jgi:hypothetical protein
MLAPMELAAASAGPWLLLGVVVGVLLAGMVALAAVALRRPSRATATPDEGAVPEAEPAPGEGWTEDDLPGFLDHPPGVATEADTAAAGEAVLAPAQRSAGGDVPLRAPSAAESPVRRAVPAHAAAGAPQTGRYLLVLTALAVVLIGIAAAIAAVTDPGGSTAPARSAAEMPAPPTWDLPDLAALPERPEPGDPDAGRLATSSVPIGSQGALARLAFEGLILERRAVGVTAAYPSISVTAADLPGGPALAHVQLPVWNCLTDSAPADPDAAGCRRLPTEYAELATPALEVTPDGEGLRVSGRFATYVRPAGSDPEWTGRAYRLAVHIAPDDDSASGTLHLGTERTDSVDDPLLSEFRRGR